MDCSRRTTPQGSFCATPGVADSYGLRRYCECTLSDPGTTPATFTEQARNNADARMRRDNWDTGVVFGRNLDSHDVMQ